MANHYHLAVRRSTVDLATSLHSLQGKFSRAFNRRWERTGSLWQSRYHAKLVDEREYLWRVVLSIHLNPVRAGVATDPVSYRFSGHREIVKKLRRPVVDVDDALLSFDETRRAARRSYLAAIRAGVDEADADRAEGKFGGADRLWDSLPWTAEGDETLARGTSSAPRHEADLLECRPSVDALVSMACEALEVTKEEVNGKRRARELATQRRVMALVLTDRWGCSRRDLAEEFERNPELVSHWVADGRARRGKDAGFADAVDRLDEALKQSVRSRGAL